MAFYAGGAMPGEVKATHLLAVVEVVEASRVSVGIPFRRRQAMNGIHATFVGGVSASDAEDPEAAGRRVAGHPGLLAAIPMN